MPIILNNQFYQSVDELWSGREGTEWEMGGNSDYVRRYRVIVKKPGMTAVSVCRAPGIPIYGSFYITSDGSDYDLLAVLRKRTAKQEHEDDWQNWIVTLNYSRNIGRVKQEGQSADHPEKENPEIEWDFEEGQYALTRDAFGKPFVNSARMPFQPAPTFPIAYSILHLSRNELDFNKDKAALYAFALNLDDFLGSPPGMVQCLPPQAKMQTRGTFAYWRVSYKLKFASELTQGAAIGQGFQFTSFNPQFLDQGTMEWDDERQTQKQIFRNNIPVRSPVLLDGQGHDAGKDAQPRYLTFTICNSVSFADLIVNGLRG